MTVKKEASSAASFRCPSFALLPSKQAWICLRREPAAIEALFFCQKKEGEEEEASLERIAFLAQKFVCAVGGGVRWRRHRREKERKRTL
jgi:hypothetical protein